MTTREQALAALEVMRLELAKRPSGFSDQEAAERQEWANATALAVRSYLAQPEGGYVEEALERLCDHVPFGEDEKRDFALVRSALRSAKEREAAAVERTVEKAKAAMRELAHPGPGMGTHRPAVSPYALDSILAALDGLTETP